MRLSVIVPARNAERVLPLQLQSLAAQRLGPQWEGEWEVIVVDHSSSDATADVARRWSGRLPLRVVTAPPGGDVADVRNLGAARSTGELLLFCDADDEVSADWIEAMAAALDVHDVVGGAADHARLNDAATRCWRIHDHVESLPVSSRFLPFASGSNLGVRRAAFEAVDGFISGLHTAEDRDLSFRLLLQGYSLGFAPDAVIAYRHRSDLRALWRQQRAYGCGDVRLYARYRELGLPGPDMTTVIRSWLGLVARLPLALVDRSRRGQWVRIAAIRLSRLVESRRMGVWYP